MAAVPTAGVVEYPIRTYTSAAAQSRGYVVIQGGADNLVAIAGANAIVIGIVSESAPAGAALGIVRRGETPAVIGAAVAAGAWLKSDASGRVIPTTATGDNIVGQAVTSGAVAGDEIIVDVIKGIQ